MSWIGASADEGLAVGVAAGVAADVVVADVVAAGGVSGCRPVQAVAVVRASRATPPR